MINKKLLNDCISMIQKAADDPTADLAFDRFHDPLRLPNTKPPIFVEGKKEFVLAITLPPKDIPPGAVADPRKATILKACKEVRPDLDADDMKVLDSEMGTIIQAIDQAVTTVLEEDSDEEE